MNEGENLSAVSMARLEQRMAKVEQAGGRGTSAAELAKAAETEDKLKRLKAALSKVEVQVASQDARLEKSSGAERQAVARITALEALAETNKAASDKKLTSALSALEARLDAMAASLSTQTEALSTELKERSSLASHMEQSDAARSALEAKVSAIDAAVSELKSDVIKRGEEATAVLKAAASDASTVGAAHLEAQQAKISGLEALVARLTADQAAQAEASKAALEAVMSRLAVLEQAKATAVQAPAPEAEAPVTSELAETMSQLQAKVASLETKLEANVGAAELAARVDKAEAVQVELKAAMEMAMAKVAEASSVPASGAIPDEGTTAAVKELQQRVSTLEAPKPSDSAAPSLEALSHLDSRIKALEEKGSSATPAAVAASGESPELSGLKATVEALGERITSLDHKMSATAVAPPAAPPGEAGDHSAAPGADGDLASRVNALTDELHDRVSELQDKMSHLLQLIVQRVKALEVSVGKRTTDSDGRSGTPQELQVRIGHVNRCDMH